MPGGCSGGSEALTRNVRPLLNEIRHALDRLLATGETHAIDLRSIPLAPGEDEAILDTLGRSMAVASPVSSSFSNAWRISCSRGSTLAVITLPRWILK